MIIATFFLASQAFASSNAIEWVEDHSFKRSADYSINEIQDAAVSLCREKPDLFDENYFTSEEGKKDIQTTLDKITQGFYPNVAFIDFKNIFSTVTPYSPKIRIVIVVIKKVYLWNSSR